MISGSLEGAIAKVGRAAEHYRVLKYELNGGFDDAFHTVRMESDRDGLEYRFYIGELKPIDLNFSLILGDAYHNLRSALDLLVFQMHIRHYRGFKNMPSGAIKDSMFPIFLNRPEIKPRISKPTDKWDQVRRLGAKERAAIEWLQPYHGRDGRLQKRSLSHIEQMRQTLDDVNWFDIVDKHHAIYAVDHRRWAFHRPVFTPHPSMASAKRLLCVDPSKATQRSTGGHLRERLHPNKCKCTVVSTRQYASRKLKATQSLFSIISGVRSSASP